METVEVTDPTLWLLRSDDGREFIMQFVRVVQVPTGASVQQGTKVEDYPSVNGCRIQETGEPDEYLLHDDGNPVLARKIGLYRSHHNDLTDHNPSSG